MTHPTYLPRVGTDGSPAWRPLGRLHRLLQVATMPLAAALAVAAATAIHHQWLPPTAIIFGAMLAAVALAWLAESRLPFRAAWRARARGEARTDITSMLVLMMGVDPIVKRLLFPVLASAALAIAPHFKGLGWFPIGWPVVLQLVLTMVIAEFGQYWMHRAGHGLRWMWAVHAFHHQPQRIDWLNGFRVNPLNMVWHQLAGLGVLLAIGTPEKVVQMLIAIGTVVAVLQHVNADLDFAPWNRFLSTADLHRWHHASVPGGAHVNYGAVLVLWDHVFGTYRRDAHAPERVGIDGHPPRRHRYLAGMLDALRLGRRPQR
jgi:sterol desaturase/sphingolipid hydroxylase (fatty acid hydroxylase superfamily)